MMRFISVIGCTVLSVAAIGINEVSSIRAGDSRADGAWKSEVLPKDDSSSHRWGVATSPSEVLPFEWNYDLTRPTPFGYALTIGHGARMAKGRPIGAISPDLAYLAIGEKNGAVDIVDIRNRHPATHPNFPLVQIKKGSPNKGPAVRDLAFCQVRDKTTIVVGDGSEELTLWDMDGKELATLSHGLADCDIIFAPGLNDSLLVGIGSEIRITDQTLRRWDSQKKLGAEVVAMAVSENRRVLAVATADLVVTIFDAGTLKLFSTIKENGQKPTSVGQFSLAVSPKGDRVFTATQSNIGKVTVWDAKTGMQTGRFVHPNSGYNLQIQVTPAGKVRTFWVDDHTRPPFLWSPPEGVDLLPPAELHLVRAAVVKAPRLFGDQISEWRILRVITGDADLRGKTFTFEQSGDLAYVDRGIGFCEIPLIVVVPEMEGYWWIRAHSTKDESYRQFFRLANAGGTLNYFPRKRKLLNGDLVAEVGRDLMSDFDPNEIFPAAGPQRMEAAKGLVGAFERLAQSSGDAERVRALAKYATDDSADLSMWAVWMLRRAKGKEATGVLRALWKNEKWSIVRQAILDEALSKQEGTSWTQSSERLEILDRWVGPSTRSSDCASLAERLAPAVRKGDLDYPTWAALLRRGFDSTVDSDFRKRLFPQLRGISPKSKRDKQAMFELLIELIGREDMPGIRLYAIDGLKRCGPFDAPQTKRIEKAGLSVDDLK